MCTTGLHDYCWASALIDMVSSARIASMTLTWEGLRCLVATVRRGESWSQMLKTGKIMKLSSYLSMRYSHHISAWNFYHISQHESVIIYQHFLLGFPLFMPCWEHVASPPGFPPWAQPCSLTPPLCSKEYLQCRLDGHLWWWHTQPCWRVCIL